MPLDSPKLSDFTSGIPLEIEKVIWLLSERKKSPGLFIHAGPGCGKTHMAKAIVKELASKKVYALLTDFPTLIDLMSQKELDHAQIKTPDILILDGVGNEARTEKMPTNALNTVLHFRLLVKKPIIIFSRHNPKMVSTMYSEDTLSMLEEACVPVSLPYKNYRTKIAEMNRKLLTS